MIRIGSSFRDPSGYMFQYEGEFYRAVNHCYKKDLDHLFSSGLFQDLNSKELILPVEEIEPSKIGLNGVYKILRPEQIDVITYPYEWSFNMLKDAAFLTIDIQEIALKYGMSLKDASAFNIQFRDGKPVFIDTLSFELYKPGKPWIAYRQFCQHFLAPLALMSRVDPRLNRMFVTHIDGIPLDLAVKMLPTKSMFNIHIFLHVFLHSRAQNKYEKKSIQLKSVYREFSIHSMNMLLDGLKSAIHRQVLTTKNTEWSNYTDRDVHKEEYIEFKIKVITEMLNSAEGKLVLDIGANNGYFSQVAVSRGASVISADADPVCVNENYNEIRKRGERKILPVLSDITNPSPSIGWAGIERSSLNDRIRPDIIMALALIHHLVIKKNISFEMIASQFSRLAGELIIEFVPADDEKAKLLLNNRDDDFSEYTLDKFEQVFSRYYVIAKRVRCDVNSRVLFHMKKR